MNRQLSNWLFQPLLGSFSPACLGAGPWDGHTVRRSPGKELLRGFCVWLYGVEDWLKKKKKKPKARGSHVDTVAVNPDFGVDSSRSQLVWANRLLGNGLLFTPPSPCLLGQTCSCLTFGWCLLSVSGSIPSLGVGTCPTEHTDWAN